MGIRIRFSPIRPLWLLPGGLLLVILEEQLWPDRKILFLIICPNSLLRGDFLRYPGFLPIVLRKGVFSLLRLRKCD